MKLSHLLAATRREDPAEAETISQSLLTRAAYVRKEAAGIYTYLPLGWRSLQKIETIIREEMNRAGGQELLMPIIQPAELWQQSGRWERYGDEMMKVRNREGRLFSLAPTHEEMVTTVVGGMVKSYRQLPVLVYQIQNKYRDEIRPRFGLLRTREFVMKDAYSFDTDQAGLDETYQRVYEAYCRIFERAGLKYVAVEADPGAIGGSGSHEFMVTAENGEADILSCQACGYAANVEKASFRRDEAGQNEPARSMERVSTLNVRTIEELTAFLGVPASRTIKTMIYKATYADRTELVAVLVRGDREINEVKVLNAMNAIAVQLASEEEIRSVTGAPQGFAGPVGLTGVTILADADVPLVANGVVGANEANAHLRNVNYGVDYKADQVLDLALAGAGDACPRCGAPLISSRGIEVGHIFKLGTKYSEKLGISYLDRDGKPRAPIMGCYGIGVGRILAAAVEQNLDENGMILPAAIAPYLAIIVPVSVTNEAQWERAERLYKLLQETGVEVVLDDRAERPGVKFKDADLYGFPYRVTIGDKTGDGVELLDRKTQEKRLVSVEEAVEFLKNAN
jgi:prolyl-tRNA synthetase